jgi:hypothetical protein
MSTLKFNKWQSIDGVTRNAVLQVVNKNVITSTVSTSTSFVDATNMFLAITPTSATSKIYIDMVVHTLTTRSNTNSFIGLRLLRDSSVIHTPHASAGNFSVGSNFLNTTNNSLYNYVPIVFLDSPSTTNEIVYKLQFCIYENTNSGTATISSQSLPSTITLMEIAQ